MIRRLQDLRRRRQRVRRPPRRLRRLRRRPRPPGDRRGGAASGSRWARTSPSPPRTRSSSPRNSRRALRPAAVALRQLGHRGDDGRRPPDAGHHRPRPDHQGRGLLPRPPRLGEVSVFPDVGRRDRPGRRPDRRAPTAPASRARSPTSCVVVPFNDLGRVERALDAHPGQIAGMIVEPMMMNAGIIPPRARLPGARSRTSARHGALLTFDEVKTGLTVGPRRRHRRCSACTPDIVCLAKALGGGVAVRRDRRHRRGDGARSPTAAYDQVGTFNGNPLDDGRRPGDAHRGPHDAAYEQLDALRDRMRDGHRGRSSPSTAAVARGDGRRQGLRGVPPRADPRTTASSCEIDGRSATRTGWSSTTAACSCRRGARSSSGCSRSSTPSTTSTGSSRTCDDLADAVLGTPA